MKYVQVRGERHPEGLPLFAVGSGFGGMRNSGAGTPLESLALHEIAAEGLGDQAPQVETELLVALELDCGLTIVAIGEKVIVSQEPTSRAGWRGPYPGGSSSMSSDAFHSRFELRVPTLPEISAVCTPFAEV